MVAPKIGLSNRSTEMEIKTLKLSSEAQSSIRAPTVWEKPTASNYDYHYEIGGIYYQPMLRYCLDREQGEPRHTVDIPDRILSNYDKRSYKLKNIEPDYEGCLIQLYQRRMKDKNSKQIHCANEAMGRSKKNTELGLVRSAATTRDTYLSQLQLMYTEKLAREGQIGEDGRVRHSHQQEKPAVLQEEEESTGVANAILAKKKNDKRYGPHYERITVLESARLASGLPLTVVAHQAVQSAEKETSEIRKTIVEERKPMINKEFLSADNMREFLSVRNKEIKTLESEKVPVEDVVFGSTTLSKALTDVKKRVQKEGDKLLPSKLQIEELKFNYRGKAMEDIGPIEKAFILSDMYKQPTIPNFDVGYDTVC